MTTLIVQRDNGDKEGDPIVDNLLTSVDVAIQRGTAEINDHSDLKPVSLTIPYQPGLRPGQLLSIIDTDTGQSYRGKLVNMAISIRLADVQIRLQIKKADNLIVR